MTWLQQMTMKEISLCLISVCTKTYIGQTMDLSKRLSQHNSGFGTDFTRQISLRPSWIVYAFVTGFEKNRHASKFSSCNAEITLISFLCMLASLNTL